MFNKIILFTKFSMNKLLVIKFNHIKILNLRSYCQASKYISYEIKENKIIHSIFENDLSYKNNIVKSESYSFLKENLLKQVFPPNNSKELSEFNLITSQALKCGNFTLEEGHYKDTIEVFIKAIPNLTDNDLKQAITNIYFWIHSNPKIYFEPHFTSLWTSLDDKCIDSFNNFDIDTRLLIGDLWFHNKLARINKYNEYIIRKTLLDMKKLDVKYILQILFFVLLKRNMADYQTRLFQQYFLKKVDRLTVEELSIVCLSFFKTKTRFVDSDFTKKILTKVESDIFSIDEKILPFILKQLRYSFSPQNVSIYKRLLDNSIPELPNIPMMLLMQLVQMAFTAQVYNPKFLDSVISVAQEQLHNVRLKDLNKFVLALAFLNHNSPKVPVFLDHLLKELDHERRKEEIEVYPEMVFSILHSLAFWKIYPQHLISKALNPENIKAKMDSPKNIFLEDISSLNMSLTIECPHYQSSRMTAEYCQALVSKFQSRVPTKDSDNLTKIEKNTLFLEDFVAKKFKSSCVCVRHVLPHFSLTDVIVCLDNDGNPKKIPQSFIAAPSDTILPPPDTVNKWICLLVGGSKYYSMDGSHQLLGYPHLKLRQLRALGYHAIDIPWFKLLIKPSMSKSDISELAKYITNRIHKATR